MWDLWFASQAAAPDLDLVYLRAEIWGMGRKVVVAL